MANATAGVPQFTVPFTEEAIQWPMDDEVLTYYPGEMIGLTVAGYALKLDDTVSLKFLGINAESVRKDIETADVDGGVLIHVQKPRYISMLIASAAITDVGRLVYAKYSNEVQFVTGTYGNVVGRVVQRLSATQVLIDTWDTAGAARTMAATGAQSLTKWDVNKTIFVGNTAALTITLPPIANVSIGDRLTFVKTSADAEIVTLDGNASEEIDAATTLTTIDAIYDSVTMVTNGTRWVITARDIA